MTVISAYHFLGENGRVARDGRSVAQSRRRRRRRSAPSDGVAGRGRGQPDADRIGGRGCPCERGGGGEARRPTYCLLCFLFRSRLKLHCRLLSPLRKDPNVSTLAIAVASPPHRHTDPSSSSSLLSGPPWLSGSFQDTRPQLPPLCPPSFVWSFGRRACWN